MQNGEDIFKEYNTFQKNSNSRSSPLANLGKYLFISGSFLIKGQFAFTESSYGGIFTKLT